MTCQYEGICDHKGHGRIPFCWKHHKRSSLRSLLKEALVASRVPGYYDGWDYIVDGIGRGTCRWFGCPFDPLFRADNYCPDHNDRWVLRALLFEAEQQTGLAGSLSLTSDYVGAGSLAEGTTTEDDGHNDDDHKQESDTDDSQATQAYGGDYYVDLEAQQCESDDSSVTLPYPGPSTSPVISPLSK
jgi:hypothetical protein